MLKLLIVKTSSLGDIVHMLPAVYDAANTSIDMQIDWVVEESFQEVATWSPYVNRVIPIAIRRWRKSLFSAQTWQEIKQFKHRLQLEKYDVVLDSQGLLKSALVTRWVNAENQSIWGYDQHSIREPLARHFYHNTVAVPLQIHAIQRNRLLLSKVLNYSLDKKSLNYGISAQAWPVSRQFSDRLKKPYIVALHGTSKVDKEWPFDAWLRLLNAMQKEGVNLVFPWGNAYEKQRVERLQKQASNAVMLPRCDLSTLASIIHAARAVIGMDTGLMHIAAALNQQGLALYPVTQIQLTGVLTGDTHNQMENIAGKACQDIDTIIEKIHRFIRL
jgi:heptosyltransferase-1